MTEKNLEEVESVGKEVPVAKQEVELKNEKGRKVYVATAGLVGLAVTSAQMTANYMKDKNIEPKEFIKNANA